MDKLYTIFKKLEGAYADSTIRAYQKNMVTYNEFCKTYYYPILPTSTEAVVRFIDHLVEQELSAYYIRRHLTAIAHVHRMTKHPDPTQEPDVKIALRRAFRQRGRFQKQAHPIGLEILGKILKILPNNLYGIRDRLLILIAYENLLRRSEIISLYIEDLMPIDHPPYYAKILLRKSKTDPFKEGRWLYLSEETYQAAQAWLEQSNLTSGYLFRGMRKGLHMTEQLHGGQVNKILKKRAKQAGLDDDVIKKISGHSIRVGAAQDLCLAGKTLPQIMAKGRWVKTETLMRYVEHTII
jgi:site-specific recombinase XerD